MLLPSHQFSPFGEPAEEPVVNSGHLTAASVPQPQSPKIGKGTPTKPDAESESSWPGRFSVHLPASTPGSQGSGNCKCGSCESQAGHLHPEPAPVFLLREPELPFSPPGDVVDTIDSIRIPGPVGAAGNHPQTVGQPYGWKVPPIRLEKKGSSPQTT